MFRPPPLPRTLEAALRDLKEASPAVRASAAKDLARHADDHRDAVLEALTGLLKDAAAEVRGGAALALADVGATESVDALVDAVGDRDIWVRQMAITALGEIRDPRAEKRLERALGDEHPEVRFQAAMALPRVATSKEKAIQAVLVASRDDDAEVCRVSLRMAEELGDDGGGAVPPPILERAKAMIRHDAPKVALAAAVILAREGLDLGRRLLVKAAEGALEGVDVEDVAAAVELCGELRLQDARRGLERRAFGGVLGMGRDPFAWHARVSLAQLGHERAIREILAELTGWGWSRRTLAVAAAARAKLKEAKPIIAEMARTSGRADPDVIKSALSELA